MDKRYPGFTVWPMWSLAQIYVGDWVPLAVDGAAQKAGRAGMQRHCEDNGLECSMDKSAVLRKWGEGGMAMDTEAGVLWLENGHDANILRKTPSMWAANVKPPEKPIKRLRAMMVVLQAYSSSLQASACYLRAVLNAAVECEAMHLPGWKQQLGKAEEQLRQLIRGYEKVLIGGA